MDKVTWLSKKILFFIFGLSLVTLCPCGLVTSSYAEDKIVAVVNNEVITQKDLNDFLNFTRMQLAGQYKGRELEQKIQSMKIDLLNKLVEDRLILREAKVNNIQADNARVKARIDDLKKRYTSEMDFQHALTQQGITLADLENRIKEQLLTYNIVDYKIRSKIVVNPSEVTDFYEKNKAEFVIPEERDFLVVAMDKKELAQDIYEKLASGAPLGELKNKFSLSVDSMKASKGGELNKDIEETIFALDLGKVSKPLEINNVFYIFILDKINPPRQQDLFEAQDLVYRFLSENKMQQAFAKWLDELKSKAYIKISQN